MRSIQVDIAATNRLLGTNLDGAEIGRLLAAIGIETEAAAGEPHRISVTPPSFRVDLTQPEDIMEEVARTWGYDRIPTRMPRIAAGRAGLTPLRLTKLRLGRLMNGQGFTETVNYSFIRADAADALQLAEDDPRRRSVKILNPISEDQAVMRTTLIPGLLETLGRNLAHRVKHLKCFELGKVFTDRGADEQPQEEELLAALWTGDRRAAAWQDKPAPCDFYDIKGAVESLIKALRIEGVAYQTPAAGTAPYLLSGAAAAVVAADGSPLGVLGALAPEVAAGFNLKQSVFVFELAVSRLHAIIPSTITARPIPIYPSIARDITLIVPRDLAAEAVCRHIRNSGEALVEGVRIFDVFEGAPIPNEKKSLSVRVTYRSPEATLEDDAVNTIHQRLSAQLLEAFQAQLPT